MQERFIPFELGCHNRTELNLLPPILKQLSRNFLCCVLPSGWYPFLPC